MVYKCSCTHQLSQYPMDLSTPEALHHSHPLSSEPVASSQNTGTSSAFLRSCSIHHTTPPCVVC